MHERSAPGGPAEEEGGEDVALLAVAERELADVDVALRRLDDGTYDTCEVCRQPIGDDRLAADPLTRRCAAHEVG